MSGTLQREPAPARGSRLERFRKIWIERFYLFFAVSAFLLTFGLPIALLRFQLGRIDAEIERRRREAKIPE
jgi:hypothetical protein